MIMVKKKKERNCWEFCPNPKSKFTGFLRENLTDKFKYQFLKLNVQIQHNGMYTNLTHSEEEMVAQVLSWQKHSLSWRVLVSQLSRGSAGTIRWCVCSDCRSYLRRMLCAQS